MFAWQMLVSYRSIYYGLKIDRRHTHHVFLALSTDQIGDIDPQSMAKSQILEKRTWQMISAQLGLIPQEKGNLTRARI